jgi:hypothetical protein
LPFDFPASPTDGQQVTLGTTRWQWSAAQGAWMMQSGNVGPAGPQGPAGPAGPAGADGAPGPTGGVTIAVGDTAPNLPADNSLWFKSDAGALWLRYRDSDAAQWLQINSNLILPPQDGNEYVMVNGLWRLKSQSFVLDGLINFDFAVPAGARAVRVYASLMPPNPGGVSNSVLLKASLDGTTFLAGASDYHYSGFIYYSGTSAIAANLGSVVSANCYLAFNNDSNIVQEVIDLRMSMVRPTVPSAQPWYGMVHSASYQSAAANAYNVAQVRVGVMMTNAGAVTALKALRIHRNANAVFGSPSYAAVDWYY